MAYTTPITWTGVPTATQMNQQIRDNPLELLGPMDSAGWQTWIPAARFFPVSNPIASTFTVRGSEGAAARMPARSLENGAETTLTAAFWVPVAGFPTVRSFTSGPSGNLGQTDLYLRFSRIASAGEVDEAWAFSKFAGASSQAADVLTEITWHEATADLWLIPGFYKASFRRDGGAGGDTNNVETWFIGLHIAVNLE